ncbi:prepilin-type N-terminal cleavage/methylation domain-containing protein [Acinetobacter indicus]|nr:prepilin-type N-terminal cleavage/methylation domain-containing protein [Acinetobacter indicus]QIC77016.1 prepilin-type N-terminal cleavage/methylation domain-containing protein [Acinetobacter indicus]
MQRRQNGFTLIELMVTIAILGIIATMAAPSFTDMLQKRKLESEVALLHKDLKDSTLLI